MIEIEKQKEKRTNMYFNYKREKSRKKKRQPMTNHQTTTDTLHIKRKSM
jgi:hypothetical protein